MKDFVLSNGIKIPEVGYGTWLIKNEDAFWPVFRKKARAKQ